MVLTRRRTAETSVIIMIVGDPPPISTVGAWEPDINVFGVWGTVLYTQGLCPAQMGFPFPRCSQK